MIYTLIEIISNIVKCSLNISFKDKTKLQEISINTATNYNNLFITKQDQFLKTFFDKESKFYKIFNFYADYEENTSLSFLEELRNKMINSNENNSFKISFDKKETANEIIRFMSFSELWKSGSRFKLLDLSNSEFSETEIDNFLSEIEWILYLRYNLIRILESNDVKKKYLDKAAFNLIELNSTIDYLVDWLCKSSDIQYYLLWLLDYLTKINDRGIKQENSNIAYPYKYLLTEMFVNRLQIIKSNSSLESKKLKELLNKNLNIEEIDKFIFE